MSHLSNPLAFFTAIKSATHCEAKSECFHAEGDLQSDDCCTRAQTNKDQLRTVQVTYEDVHIGWTCHNCYSKAQKEPLALADRKRKAYELFTANDSSAPQTKHMELSSALLPATEEPPAVATAGAETVRRHALDTAKVSSVPRTQRRDLGNALQISVEPATPARVKPLLNEQDIVTELREEIAKLKAIVDQRNAELQGRDATILQQSSAINTLAEAAASSKQTKTSELSKLRDLASNMTVKQATKLAALWRGK